MDENSGGSGVAGNSDVTHTSAEAMEGDDVAENDDCIDDALIYSSEESSDDDMEDLLPPAALVPAVNCFEEGVTYQSDFAHLQSDVTHSVTCHSHARHEEDGEESPDGVPSKRVCRCDLEHRDLTRNAHGCEKCDSSVTSDAHDVSKDSEEKRPGGGGSRPYFLLASSNSPLRRASYPNVPPSLGTNICGCSR
jgi:hypothetical protein